MYLVLKCFEEKCVIEMPEDFNADVEVITFQDKAELDKYFNEETTLKTIKISESCNEVTTDSECNGSSPKSIFILKNECYRRIHFSQIMWVEASRSYSYIYVAGEQPLVVTFPLSEVEKKLPRPQFIRIHRSFIVNTDYVDAFNRSSLFIKNKTFPVSKNYQKDVFGQFLVLGGNSEKRNKKEKEERL